MKYFYYLNLKLLRKGKAPAPDIRAVGIIGIANLIFTYAVYETMLVVLNCNSLNSIAESLLLLSLIPLFLLFHYIYYYKNREVILEKYHHTSQFQIILGWIYFALYFILSFTVVIILSETFLKGNI